MEDKKNNIKTVWLYAIILFTSAFIVLLFTAYSQIRLNNNLNEYKNQISSQNKEKNSFISYLNSSQLENKKLKDENIKLRNEINITKLESVKSTKRTNELEKNNASVINAYEALLLAENELKNDNYIKCAEIINNNEIYGKLGSEGKATYLRLKEKSYYIAGRKLYTMGYEEYGKSSYDKAISLFERSLKLLQNAYYSDDCLFYKAYSEYRQSKIASAEKSFSFLIKNYPDSSFKREAENILLKK